MPQTRADTLLPPIGVSGAYRVNITADPIGLAGGDVNYYVYTKGNPVNRKDPKGLADCPCGKWIGHGVDGSISGLYGGNISVMRYVLHQQKKMHYSNSMF
ncbi:MAG: hypothetical protein A4E62_00131 [Syntrophorhabdus sp. PtaU1.Bin002]|nr:MAG: hypothetical protein A4E62_00131 [Syntrophorhabdus sp. PtaU1.Bin002]